MKRLLFDPSLVRQIGPVALDGTVYRVRMTWRDRLRGWYLDLYLADGTAVSLGNRVCAGGLLVRDLSRHDDEAPAGGVLVALGKDKYVREDLSLDGGINVYYLTREEWEGTLLDTSEDVQISDA